MYQIYNCSPSISVTELDCFAIVFFDLYVFFKLNLYNNCK